MAQFYPKWNVPPATRLQDMYDSTRLPSILQSFLLWTRKRLCVSHGAETILVNASGFPVEELRACGQSPEPQTLGLDSWLLHSSQHFPSHVMENKSRWKLEMLPAECFLFLLAWAKPLNSNIIITSKAENLEEQY